MSVKGSWNRVRNQRAFAANYAAIFRGKRRKGLATTKYTKHTKVKKCRDPIIKV